METVQHPPETLHLVREGGRVGGGRRKDRNAERTKTTDTKGELEVRHLRKVRLGEKGGASLFLLGDHVLKLMLV